MSEKTERRKVLTVGKEISRVNIINDGKAVEILLSASELDEKKRVKKVQQQSSNMEFERLFPIVDIENLSPEDLIMEYKPYTDPEKYLYEILIKAKEIGMKNFRKPAMDPSFADDGETIIYCAGEKPAIGKHHVWWDENAPKFMPEKNSRLMDDFHYIVWLGILIKELIDNGQRPKTAWNDVCQDSSGIGHYKDSLCTNNALERTGSRQIGKWFDLGNTCKLTKNEGALISIWKDTNEFKFFGGSYRSSGERSPLLHFNDFPPFLIAWENSVGMLMLDV